ncbi:MAG: T9SS type A sorting domain-containing protein [Bacteroidales bacterium]|nr:T9SS type A sorting domain-containing protein [Bacteroidales bacterium]
MKIPRLLIAALLALPTTAPLARANSLVLNLADGTQVYYLVSADEHPRLIMKADGSLVLNGEHYDVLQVESFRYTTTDYSGAEGTRQGASDLIQISADALSRTERVTIYDASGSVVWQGRGDAALQTLTSGVYMVRQGSLTYKIQIR